MVLTLLCSKAIAFNSPTLTATEVVRTQDSRPKGLAFNNDGTKFYLTSSWDDEINVYDLTTAWDITTAVHKCAEPHWTSGNGNARHIAFSADGTFMFVMRGGNTGTDYVYFQFGKYTPPFGADEEALRKKMEDAEDEANSGYLPGTLKNT